MFYVCYRWYLTNKHRTAMLKVKLECELWSFNMSQHESSQPEQIKATTAEVSPTLINIPLRAATIGRDTLIKRALPSRQKRMIGAWCFLDHAGPTHFAAGEGLDVGPHPHIGLQTFTWMIEGSLLHSDSLGTSNQLISPKQVNLMTAGHGISHTEVSPQTETCMHTVQLWIALPEHKRHMPPRFDHYATLPLIHQDALEFTVLVGEYLQQRSPVEVYSELLAVDIIAQQDRRVCLPLNPQFEYGIMVLHGQASAENEALNQDNLLVLQPGRDEIYLDIKAGTRILLLGGLPFESPILLWWNFVGRTQAEIELAREQWQAQDPRFGQIDNYHGERLEAPILSAKIRASR